MNRALRWGLGQLFDLALGSYPAGWRTAHSHEARQVFHAGLEARCERGSWLGLRYGMAAVLDALVNGTQERRQARYENGQTGWGAGMMTDLRYAFRRLWRAPGLTAAVLILLGLGVGANAAVFSVLRTALLSPPPFPEPHELVLPRMATVVPGVPDTMKSSWSWPVFSEYRESAADLYDGLAGYAIRSGSLTEPGDAQALSFELVTEGYFETLGLTPVLGRFLTPADELPGAGLVAVLSQPVWEERFGGDPSAVGRGLTLNGVRFTVVGVAPAGFRGLTGAARLWVPAGRGDALFHESIINGRHTSWLNAIGRIAAGSSALAVQQRSLPMAQVIDARDSQLVAPEEISFTLTSLNEVWTRPETRSSVWLAMAAALLVLTIAVVNLSALLANRSRRERRATAVRLALGAPHGRLVRERMVESLLLSGGAGLIGIGLAALAMNGLRSVVPGQLFLGADGDVISSSVSALRIDPLVAGFGLLMAVLAGLAFGAGPSLVHRGIDLAPALRGQRNPRRGRVGGRGRWGVGFQVAVSAVLLIGAGLMMSTLISLHAEQKGFDPDGLLVLRYSLVDAQESEAREFHLEFRDRLVGLPGVRSAGIGTIAPLGGHFIQTNVTQIVGEPEIPRGDRERIGVSMIDGASFQTLGTQLLAGRTFTPDEYRAAEQVTVLSSMAAERLFPGEDPIGREFMAGVNFGDDPLPYRVIGVVEDVLYSDPTEGMMAEMYLPFGLWAPAAASIFVRTDGDPTSVVPGARDLLRSMNASVPFTQIQTGADLRSRGVARARVLVWLLGILAGLAILLSSAGLWAVVSQAVAERRREIGIRMALGARAAEVEGLVFRQGALPIVLGGIAGVTIAALAAPRIADLLFGVGPRDPGVYMMAGAILAAVALVATWLPARRAARIDPRTVMTGD